MGLCQQLGASLAMRRRARAQGCQIWRPAWPRRRAAGGGQRPGRLFWRRAPPALGGACGAGRRSLEGSCAAAGGKLLGFSVLAARGCAGAGLAAHHPKRVRLLHHHEPARHCLTLFRSITAEQM